MMTRVAGLRCQMVGGFDWGFSARPIVQDTAELWFLNLLIYILLIYMWCLVRCFVARLANDCVFRAGVSFRIHGDCLILLEFLMKNINYTPPPFSWVVFLFINIVNDVAGLRRQMVGGFDRGFSAIPFVHDMAELWFLNLLIYITAYMHMGLVRCFVAWIANDCVFRAGVSFRIHGDCLILLEFLMKNINYTPPSFSWVVFLFINIVNDVAGLRRQMVGGFDRGFSAMPFVHDMAELWFLNLLIYITAYMHMGFGKVFCGKNCKWLCFSCRCKLSG